VNATEDKKLHDIFEYKYKELAFSEDRSFKTWSSYLRHIRCIPCEWAFQMKDIMSVSENTKYEIIHNPSPFGGFILVPEETAFRILSIGLP
jgi:hypothetical protein